MQEVHVQCGNYTQEVISLEIGQNLYYDVGEELVEKKLFGLHSIDEIVCIEIYEPSAAAATAASAVLPITYINDADLFNRLSSGKGAYLKITTIHTCKQSLRDTISLPSSSKECVELREMFNRLFLMVRTKAGQVWIEEIPMLNNADCRSSTPGMWNYSELALRRLKSMDDDLKQRYFLGTLRISEKLWRKYVHNMNIAQKNVNVNVDAHVTYTLPKPNNRQCILC